MSYKVDIEEIQVLSDTAKYLQKFGSISFFKEENQMRMIIERQYSLSSVELLSILSLCNEDRLLCSVRPVLRNGNPEIDVVVWQRV